MPRREIPLRTKACGPRAGPSNHSSASSSPLLAQTWPQASKLLTVVMSRKTAFDQLQFRHFRHHFKRRAKSLTVSLGRRFLVRGWYPRFLLSSRAVLGDILTRSFCFTKTARSFPVAPRCFLMIEEKTILWCLSSLWGRPGRGRLSTLPNVASFLRMGLTVLSSHPTVHVIQQLFHLLIFFKLMISQR